MTELTIEEFPNGIKVFQGTDGYKFTKDAVDLAKFCKIKHTDNVLEMCAGSGVVSFYAYSLCKFNKLYLNEIQHSNCEIINQNIHLNNLCGIAKCLEGNLKNLNYASFDKKLDVIVCNPPYFKVQGSKINDNYSIAISRHEIEVTLDDIVYKASELIKDKGRFYLCMTPNRMTEVVVALSKHKFECKTIKFLQNHKGEVNLCLFEAVYKAQSGVKIILE